MSRRFHRLQSVPVSLLLLCALCRAQEAPAEAPAELSQDVPQEQLENPAPNAPAPPEGRTVSLKSFARNFFSDQKMIWTFPAKLATGKHVVPTLAVLGGTAAVVVAVDPTEGRYFRRHTST